MLSFIAKTVITVMLAAGCFWVPIARGQDHNSYQASIPFAFYIDNTLLPAGTYHITQPSQNMLLYRNERGIAVAYQLVLAKDLANGAATGQLTFDQYGSSYFLREFSVPNQGSGPHVASASPRGRLESRTAKKFLAARNQEVALSTVPPR
jgi:hypothetical protein